MASLRADPYTKKCLLEYLNERPHKALAEQVENGIVDRAACLRLRHEVFARDPKFGLFLFLMSIADPPNPDVPRTDRPVTCTQGEFDIAINTAFDAQGYPRPYGLSIDRFRSMLQALTSIQSSSASQ